MEHKHLSAHLKQWLEEKGTKNLSGLIRIFGKRSIATIILVLMLFPSLPLPTGGISHLFEIISMLLAIELIIGRQTIWLPKKILKRDMGKVATKKIIPFMIKRITWIEKHSRPWGRYYLENTLVTRLIGLVLLVFIINAFIAPPFSGLDTIPSLATVFVCVSVILGDIRFFIVGFIVGLANLVATIIFSSFVINYFKSIYNLIF